MPNNKNENDAYYLLKDLALALNNSFISSWQTTAGWQKELNAALEYIKNQENKS